MSNIIEKLGISGAGLIILKDCPFCGSKNVKYEFSGSQGYITCNHCNAVGSEKEKAADPYCDAGAAYDGWNVRVDPIKDEMLEALIFCKQELSENAYFIDMVDSAIKKATGKTWEEIMELIGV